MNSTVSQPKLDHLRRRVERVVMSTPVCDIHTHLYDPAFGDQLLWGIDDLLVYHYLVAEAFRYSDLDERKFLALSKSEQANLVWESLFIQRSPVSEACRGVLTTLQRLGLDVWKRDLGILRRWYAKQKLEDHLDRCFEVAKVDRVHMSNSPFDSAEMSVWKKGFRRDERFVSALRVDELLTDWPRAVRELSEAGYGVSADLGRKAVTELRRFLRDVCRRMEPVYLMASLPPDFSYPVNGSRSRVLEKVILPYCRDSGLPLALMLGVKRGVNPALQLAGDGVGRSDLESLQNLCMAHPGNRFLATALSLENQHELCVLGRKFRNLHLFGCWWFVNVPESAAEITRLRLELLGFSFTAQHSDARVLDQLVYKWHHYRRILVDALTNKYADLMHSGWEPSMQEIQRDAQGLLGDSFLRFCA